MKVGILTGGGDAPGLNATIYGVLLRAYQEKDIEVIGIKQGWKIFTYPIEEIPNVKKHYMEKLDIGELDDLHTRGGTILYTSRSNPFETVTKINDPKEKETLQKKIALDLKAKMQLLELDAMVIIGGDDTCGVGAAMFKYTKAKVVACPKTIDNDLAGTDYTFGFFSSAQLASNSLDSITTTAHSHQRIFVVEIMGRDAGWLTLFSGLSSGADIILLPETPFDFQRDVIDVLRERVKAGYSYHIIACAEGAYPSMESLERDFTVVSAEDIHNLPLDSFGHPALHALKIADKIAKQIRKTKDLQDTFEQYHVNFEVRSVVLGHTMRAGTPNVYDRITGLRYGFHAMSMLAEGIYGKMSSLQGTQIRAVDIEVGSKKKFVSPDSDLVKIRDAMVDVKYKSKEKYFL
ncbi:MAG: ATP-dependent 6-phosphofructokinase [Promethearchaeota archaeon]|nr:MAG: ATP-dependent 6-phosphofructokinase [Candidatus Lokiarchaeota archaeon]